MRVRWLLVVALSSVVIFPRGARVGEPLRANAGQGRTAEHTEESRYPFRIAKAYGLDGWDTVEELHYTFNIAAGERKVRRSWIWRPKDRRVTFRDEIAGGEPFTYSLDALSDHPSEELKAVDHRFVNDQYWLLFALHLAWDRDATRTVTPNAPLPIDGGSATKITVQYPPTGGYTPGDAYDLYVGTDDHVVQWVYRQGGRKEPSMVTTWGKYRHLGPLLISTEFQSDDGKFKVWFSDLSIKVTGSDTYLLPE
jgi:hypothetical protein